MPKTLTDRVTILETIIPTICDDLNDIKNNHIKHIQDDVQEITKVVSMIQNDSAVVKTDVAWLKRFFWIIATASIGSLIAQLVNWL